MQPLTEVVASNFYDSESKRYKTIIFVPYSGNKTGNYTFHSVGQLENSMLPVAFQAWFYIYFNCMISEIISKWNLYDLLKYSYNFLAAIFWCKVPDEHIFFLQPHTSNVNDWILPYFDVNRGDIVIPCRITRPELEDDLHIYDTVIIKNTLFPVHIVLFIYLHFEKWFEIYNQSFVLRDAILLTVNLFGMYKLEACQSLGVTKLRPAFVFRN
jgi:hypothetical protein